MDTEKQLRGKRIRDVRNQLGLSQEQLGKMLGGSSKGSISGYEAGDNNPSPEDFAKIAKIGGVSLDWLITGKEPGSESIEPQPFKKKGEIAASIQPGRREAPTRLKQSQSAQTRIPSRSPVAEESSKTDSIDESFTMSEMVTMTIEVLESKTVYRSALASNVRAFHQAVKMEGEMQGVKEDLRQMRAEHRAEMEELKEMIRSLGGAAPEKREPAANA